MITNREISLRYKIDRVQSQNSDGHNYENDRWRFRILKNKFYISSKLYSAIAVALKRPKNVATLSRFEILYDMAVYHTAASHPFPAQTHYCDYLRYAADPVLSTILIPICQQLPVRHLLYICQNSAIIYYGTTYRSKTDAIKIGLIDGQLWIDYPPRYCFACHHISDPKIESLVQKTITDILNHDKMLQDYTNSRAKHKDLIEKCPNLISSY